MICKHICIHIYLIYMYERDLALNNIQWLICDKTKPNLTSLIQIICSQLYGIKYSYLILIIYTQLCMVSSIPIYY